MPIVSVMLVNNVPAAPEIGVTKGGKTAERIRDFSNFVAIAWKLVRNARHFSQRIGDVGQTQIGIVSEHRRIAGGVYSLSQEDFPAACRAV